MKKIFLIPIIVVLAAALVVSTIFISSYYSESKKQKSEYDEIASLVKAINPTKEVSDESETTTGKGNSIPYATDDGTGDETDTLSYTDLTLLNEDTVGWIRIDGTAVNYPVVQSKTSPNFYIHHNFYKQESVYGCPFVQDNCDVNKPSDNVVIYGHHMNDGSMFAALSNYQSYDYYTQHRYIQFDTLHENHKYEVVAAFDTKVGTGFRYYSFINASSENDFNTFVSKCKSLSFYDTGANVNFGDKLLTLSTCDNITNGGRIVVVAKRVS